MVSDFFLPVAGGIEVHIYQLAVQLTKLGHRVIVVTHAHPPDRVGIRYLLAQHGKKHRDGTVALKPKFIKVYHLPLLPIASSASLPNFLLCLPYFRSIFIKEGIQIVHGHGSLSSMAHESLFHAPFFKFNTPSGEEKIVRTLFTDHSLFGFDDAVGILTNKLLAAALRNVDSVICVSHTGKENTCLRAQLDPRLVAVVPNALVPDQFAPDLSKVDPNYITIVVISRLVYRKGIDLLVASAPHICRRYPNVRFIVAGHGPKIVELQQIRDECELQDRIELLGPVPPSDVRKILNRGQIYLATSLTEAFGMSIIEAACAGLLVVSTKVGGVAEVLPQDMIEFAMPDVQDIVRALSRGIEKIKKGTHDPYQAHARVRNMYSWADVARRVERVYERSMRRLRATDDDDDEGRRVRNQGLEARRGGSGFSADGPSNGDKNEGVNGHEHEGEDEEDVRGVYARMSRFLTLGPFFGPILCIIVAVQSVFLWILDVLEPRDTIDRVEDMSDATVQELLDRWNEAGEKWT